jgi:alpha-beta hydrolase superfamily lysophospholipase
MRRLLRVLVVAVLLLVLVFYAGGGWYFSGRIRSDALAVTPYPPARDLILTPVAGGLRISSTDPDERRMLAGPSTYGVQWKGGYGQVSGPVVSREGRSVVRRFTVLTGATPAAGTQAELRLEAWPVDPAYGLGKGVQEVRYTSPAGRFPAWLVDRPRTDGGTWAVLVHGKGGSRTEMVRMARSFGARGLSTLDITYRNDPGVPRDPSGSYGYGATEWRDLRGAVQYASSHGAERVVLGADSMGGGIVASYLRHRDGGLPVVGLVLDAPMLDLTSTIRFGARQISLPLLGPVPDSLTWTARSLASARFDVDWDRVDYLDDTSWLRVPTLLFHGTADTTVPIATSRELARAKPRLVTLVEAKGVEHVRSWNADPAAYDAAVARLLGRAGVTGSP